MRRKVEATTKRVKYIRRHTILQSYKNRKPSKKTKIKTKQNKATRGKIKRKNQIKTKYKKRTQKEYTITHMRNDDIRKVTLGCRRCININKKQERHIIRP